MQTLLASLLIAGSLAFAAPPSDQTKAPDMSGTWKTIIEKSIFPDSPPAEMTGIIKQEGDKMTVTQDTVQQDGNRNSVTLEFNTAGKQTVNVIGDTELRTVMKPEGGILREETDFTIPGSRFKRKSTMTLSSGGKVLTMDGTIIREDNSEAKIKIVMEKQ